MPNQFTASLWGDEGFSAILSMKSIPQIISIIARDTSPPLYNITEHIWFGIFGTSEVAIRSLSFLYFLIAIFFVCKIGVLIWDRKTGIIAAILSFLNPFFFTYAFEGRMYSILAAGATASMYFFLKRNWVAYVIATAAMLYSHHFSIFIIFVQGLWFLKEFFFGKRKVAISMLLSFVAVAILYSPWLLPLYNQTRMVGGGFWLGTPTLKDLGRLVLTYLNIGLIALLTRKWLGTFQKSLVFLVWFILPILATWLISQKFSSIFFDRYLLYTIPAAMVLAASERTKISRVAIAAVVLAFFVTDAYYFTHPIKRPFRELAAYVKETKLKEDFIINWYSNGTHHIWETKYYQIPGPIYVSGEGELPFFVGTALMEESDIIRQLPEGIGRVGVVTSGPVEEITLAGYTKEVEKSFGTLKFLWYQKAKTIR
jgi:uncharacterized membrane protein